MTNNFTKATNNFRSFRLARGNTVESDVSMLELTPRRLLISVLVAFVRKGNGLTVLSAVSGNSTLVLKKNSVVGMSSA